MSASNAKENQTGSAGKPRAKRWYAEGLCFECTQCGGCCSGAPGFVWVSAAEAQVIAARLSMKVEDFLLEHARFVYQKYSLKEKPDGDCIFLTRNPIGCLIYEVRPVQCRTFPFWTEVMRKKEYWQNTAKDCPGMNQGRLYTAEEIDVVLEANEEI